MRYNVITLEQLIKKANSKVIYNFLRELEYYQANNFGNNSESLYDSYNKLPEDIKNKIRCRFRNNWVRGIDTAQILEIVEGNNTQVAVSFTNSEFISNIFGDYILPSSFLQSYSDIISTEKILHLYDKYNFNIGDDEGEVIVFNITWNINKVITLIDEKTKKFWSINI